ncbi:Kinesin-like protein [Drosera capensis]
MSNFLVCARFRPLSSKEKRDFGDSVSVQKIDDESFVFKDEKDGDVTFCFDKVFYEESDQADVYEFLVLPIVEDAVSGINGTIITYGQTGAGKTYSMEGTDIVDRDEQNKGLLPRVIDEIFKIIKCSKEATTYSSGIANRAIGETQMNMASSRSHCIYIFTVQQELLFDKRIKSGKLILVDLAGSEKVEKTRAEGRVLEEAKTINKSLSALGNVINALTCSPHGKINHVPYRDSKLTRILQDALGGNSRTALLCCCSPSSSNASESLSTLRFGLRSSILKILWDILLRAKHIKASSRVYCCEDESVKKEVFFVQNTDESCERTMNKLKERISFEDVELLEELLVQEGILFSPDSAENFDSALDIITSRTISSLHQALEELVLVSEELMRENKNPKARLAAYEKPDKLCFWDKMSFALSYFLPSS